jgi:hypothetical protein
MRALSIIIFSLIAVLAKAEYPPRIAASDRIVTLEQWGGRGNDALVWAVRPTEITIYHIFSSTPDEVLATVPIQKEEAEEIRNVVSEIGKAERGKVWFDANVFDGTMLRISFSASGDLRADRIEVANHWRPEFKKLIDLISSKSPEKWRIGFRERVAHLERGHNVDIRCISVREYYRGK